MKLLTLKIPEEMDARIRAEAKRKGVPKSVIVRDALFRYFFEGPSTTESFTEWAQDLAGSAEGPADLSASPKWMKGFGK